MKRILITGKNSYIGTSFKNWVSQWGGDYYAEMFDLKDKSWSERSFAGYDVVLHTAGIAHVKETRKNKDLYYKVNRDLTVAIANKGKVDGVKQFVFLSSMSVYGIESGVIKKNTVPRPNSHYGKSKLQAENRVKCLNDHNFKVAILRPPMVYGKGCKGNYQKLSKLAKILPVFPDVDNKRSMIYIDNLCECIRLVVENNEEGIFFPQNDEYVNSTEMVKEIAGVQGKKLRATKIYNHIINFSGLFISVINKVFGSLYYEKDMSKGRKNYCTFNFKESIRRTEK